MIVTAGPRHRQRARGVVSDVMEAPIRELDIQTYKRAHGQDIKRRSKAEGKHPRNVKLERSRSGLATGSFV